MFFHVVSALAMSSVTVRILEKRLAESAVKSVPKAMVGGGLFLLGIAWHTILDIAPHQYPFRSKPDIIISVVLFVGFCSMIKPRWLWVFGIAFLGNIFPDLVDLGPSMLKDLTGWPIPIFPEKVFFCHKQPWSGSIFDGSRTLESHIYHSLALMLGITGIAFGWRNVNRKIPRAD